MSDHPILFKGEMVRALLAGDKLQTRRLYKPRYPEPYEVIEDGVPFQCGEDGVYHRRAEPYGIPGDRLWVKETWCSGDTWFNVNGSEGEVPQTIRYRADNSALHFRSAIPGDSFVPNMYAWSDPKKWRQSIFMPRWASRITLNVTDVRVERLHRMTDGDAFAEGIPLSLTARDDYAELFDEINGDGSWAANPLVWVVTFDKPRKDTP